MICFTFWKKNSICALVGPLKIRFKHQVPEFSRRDGLMFSIKDQRINIFGLAGPMVSVATAQLCRCRVTAATGST